MRQTATLLFTRRSLAGAAGAVAAAIAAATSTTAVPAAAATPIPGRDPLSSGTLADWHRFSRRVSTAGVDRTVADAHDGIRLVGDSVASALLPAFRTSMSEAKRPVSWDCWAGRPTPACADAVAASARAGRIPPTLVVVSGANDIFAPATFAPAASRLLAAIPSHTQVVWVTPYVSRRRTPIADTRNSALVCLALERLAAADDRLHLVRWYDFLSTKPTRIAAYLRDGIHPSEPGVAALNALVRASTI